MLNTDKSILDEIQIPSLRDRGISLYIKRDDLIHDIVSGNKWRKLKYNVESCISRKKKGLLTFGGAYSNHLVATAYACNKKGIECIGIVRGDELNEESNATLKNCKQLGMKLIFVSREDYKLRIEKAYVEGLSIKFPNFLIIPEGGANYHGIIGCQEILREVNIQLDHIFVAQGTTTTSCGIAMSLKPDQLLHVFPALKGFNSMTEMTQLYLQSGLDMEWIDELLSNVRVHGQYHFGGYGKYTDELLTFIKEFYQKYKLKLDPIYTAKVMYGLLELVDNEEFDNAKILFIHTGGLQGAASVEERASVNLYG